MPLPDEGDALESFDFDSFLHSGDSKDAYESNDFGFENPPTSKPASTSAFGAQTTGGLFGNSGPSSTSSALPSFSSYSNTATSAGTSTSPFASAVPSTSLFGNASTTSTSKGFGSVTSFGGVSGGVGLPILFGRLAAPAGNLFGGSAAPVSNPFAAASAATSFGATSSGPVNFPTSNTPSVTKENSKDAKPKTDDELLDAIIALQTFEGFWEWSEQLFDIIGVPEAVAEKELTSSMLGIGKKQFATALAVAVLGHRLAKLKGVWELVVEKAMGWLGEESEKIVGLAIRVVEKN
jgi:hypothetical protein